MFILCMCLYVVYISPISVLSIHLCVSIHIQSSDMSNLSSVEENKVDSTAAVSSEADMIKVMQAKFDALQAKHADEIAKMQETMQRFQSSSTQSDSVGLTQQSSQSIDMPRQFQVATESSVPSQSESSGVSGTFVARII